MCPTSLMQQQQKLHSQNNIKNTGAVHNISSKSYVVNKQQVLLTLGTPM